MTRCDDRKLVSFVMARVSTVFEWGRMYSGLSTDTATETDCAGAMLCVGFLQAFVMTLHWGPSREFLHWKNRKDVVSISEQESTTHTWANFRREAPSPPPACLKCWPIVSVWNPSDRRSAKEIGMCAKINCDIVSTIILFYLVKIHTHHCEIIQQVFFVCAKRSHCRPHIPVLRSCRRKGFQWLADPVWELCSSVSSCSRSDTRQESSPEQWVSEWIWSAPSQFCIPRVLH